MIASPRARTTACSIVKDLDDRPSRSSRPLTGPSGNAPTTGNSRRGGSAVAGRFESLKRVLSLSAND